MTFDEIATVLLKKLINQSIVRIDNNNGIDIISYMCGAMDAVNFVEEMGDYNDRPENT